MHCEGKTEGDHPLDEEWTDPAGGGYGIVDGQFVRQVEVKGQVLMKPIANFAARAVEDVTRDDGAEQQRTFIMEGQVKVKGDYHPLPRREIAARQAGGLAWIADAWGMEPGALPGQSREVIHAIRLYSGMVPRRIIYSHLGFRQLDSGWVFLHARGALGADRVEVEPAPALVRYALPANPEDVRAAMHASLRLLELGPASIVYPVWAAIWRAPTCSFHPSATLVYFVGESGALKSTVAALLLGHFGDFASRTELPTHFEDTENAVEKVLFRAMDVPFVVDDLTPELHHGRLQEVMKRFSRLVRDVGNVTGRRRMRADMRLRQQYFPPGLVLATGEFLPDALALSAKARLFPIPFTKGDIDVERLTQVQQLRCLLPQATAAYIRHLCERAQGLRQELTGRFEVLRDRATAEAHAVAWHPMLAEHVANLALGLELGLDFAVQVEALSEDEAATHHEKGRAALMQLANAHAKYLGNVKPSTRFLQALAETLETGQAWLAERQGGGVAVGQQAPPAMKFGWIDNDGIFLRSEAFATVLTHLQRPGGLMVDARGLKTTLAHEGYLIRSKRDRFDGVQWCEGRSERVLHFRRDALGILVEASSNGTPPDGEVTPPNR